MTVERSPRSDPLRRSVVKLFTVTKKPNHYQPWDLEYQRNSGGSGCILEGNRILTNAHVVSHQVYVQVLKMGDTRKYSATVEHVDHDSEMAILRVEHPSFFEDTIPVRFGELPFRQDKVAVYGFPIGGNELCITEGVVSRIEVLRYSHSQRDLLAIQTDAAINPGNSGGPVFMGGHLIGIAFQAYDQKQIEKTGYVVPMPVLRHFLKDIENGVCDGVPALGAFWQKLEGESLRELLQVPDSHTGVLVTRVVYGSSAWEILQERDVLVSVDGTPVESDGTIRLREDDRVNFSYLISQHQVGEHVELDVVRDGKMIHLSVPLTKPKFLVPRPQPGRRPTYYIFGGIVFMPLTYDYLASWDWKDVDPRFRHYYTNELPSARKKEIVIVNQVLAHDINVGYHQVRGTIVERINGVPITEMRDVLEAVKAPLGKFHVIEVDNHAGKGDTSDYHSSFGTHMVIRADVERTATKEILTQYGIPSDRSADLPVDP
jgi:S1-C subfamily serine protease